MSKKSITELIKDKDYRETIIDSLSNGIHPSFLPSFKEVLNYVIDEKFHLFDLPEFKDSFYYDDDETLDLVLPAVRRVFGKIFIDPPSLFKDTSIPENPRYQLFILYFNLDDFINYLVEMMIKCKESLIYFEYIDRTSETLSLIVDNFIAGLVKQVRQCDDIDSEIKSLKIKVNREQNINEILK